jgi:hypothetical protein
MNMTHVVVLAAMVLLPIGLFVWSRRRRSPGMDPRAAWEAVKSGAPITNELAGAVGRYVAEHGRPAEGVVEGAIDADKYWVRLPDGTRLRAGRVMRLWRHGVVFAPGDRVRLSMVPGDDYASITGRL